MDTSRLDISRLSTPQRVSAVAILVVALSAFLPWVSVFGISVLGIEGDGRLTLLLAVAGGVVLAMSTGLVGEPRLAGRNSEIGLLVMAALVALVGFVDMNGAAAMGLYLTLLGGIAWVAGAGWQLSVSRKAASDESAPA